MSLETKSRTHTPEFETESRYIDTVIGRDHRELLKNIKQRTLRLASQRVHNPLSKVTIPVSDLVRWSVPREPQDTGAIRWSSRKVAKPLKRLNHSLKTRSKSGDKSSPKVGGRLPRDVEVSSDPARHHFRFWIYIYIEFDSHILKHTTDARKVIADARTIDRSIERERERERKLSNALQSRWMSLENLNSRSHTATTRRPYWNFETSRSMELGFQNDPFANIDHLVGSPGPPAFGSCKSFSSATRSRAPPSRIS